MRVFLFRIRVDSGELASAKEAHEFARQEFRPGAVYWLEESEVGFPRIAPTTTLHTVPPDDLSTSTTGPEARGR